MIKLWWPLKKIHPKNLLHLYVVMVDSVRRQCKAMDWKRLNISRLDSASLLLLLLSPQSGKMSLYPKWAGVPARPTGEIGTGFEILRPAGQPTLRACPGRSWRDNRFKRILCRQILPFHRNVSFCGRTNLSNFPLPTKSGKKWQIWAARTTGLNPARPVGTWWRLVVASLYIHTPGRLEDNAEAAPSIPPATPPSYASQWLTGSGTILHFNADLLLSTRPSCSFPWWWGWSLLWIWWHNQDGADGHGYVALACISWENLWPIIPYSGQAGRRFSPVVWASEMFFATNWALGKLGDGILGPSKLGPWKIWPWCFCLANCWFRDAGPTKTKTKTEKIQSCLTHWRCFSSEDPNIPPNLSLNAFSSIKDFRQWQQRHWGMILHTWWKAFSLSLFKMVALWQEQTASVKAEVALTGGGWMQISIPHLCSLSWAGGTASVTPHLGDVPVPRICHFCGIEKIWYPVISLGTGIRKIWYRNKSWNRYPSNLVPEKGLWTGIGQIWYQKKYWYWYRKYLV